MLKAEVFKKSKFWKSYLCSDEPSTAVKIYSLQPEILELNHPCLPKILDSGEKAILIDLQKKTLKRVQFFLRYESLYDHVSLDTVHHLLSKNDNMWILDQIQDLTEYLEDM